MTADLDMTALKEGSAAEILTPADASYDEARAVWNAVIDRRPAVIARCISTADVVTAVRFGTANDLVIAVRGGGHNVAGTAVVDDGLVIDLSPMREVLVDTVGRTVRVAGGATLGDLDRATQAHGLAVPVGVVSETGVAGLALSGGMGWLRRQHGLTCDNLRSATIVTADGSVITASAEEHPDLFWGLRGGGGNFGVVTSFEFRAHPAGPDVSVCFAVYPAEDAPTVLRATAEFVAGAPEEVSPLAFLGFVPPEETFPPESHGRPYVAVAAVHPGDPAEGQRVLQPLRALAEPIVDLSGAMPYVEAQGLLDEEYPAGRRYYWTSIELSELSDAPIGRLMDRAASAPSALSTVDVWLQGGAMSRIPRDATAFGDRSAPILIGIEANWEDPGADDANISWARTCVEDLRPFSGGGTYLNFPGFLEDRAQQLRAAFGDNYDRLVDVKTAYDPTNVFRVNHNIPPR